MWAGTDAQRQGLVDKLGDFDEAVQAAARRAHLSTYAAEIIEPEVTWAQALALQLKSRVALSLAGLVPGERQLAQVAQLAQRLDPITREAARLSRFSMPNRLYAYCFCELR